MTERSLLDAEGIEKSFPGVRALGGANLRVRKGEVHALLGENGAGKSTLLKILAGAQAADGGSILFDGTVLSPFDTPLKRQQLGIVTIYQEFNLLPEMSVAENIYLGREPRRFGLIDWRRLFDDTRAVLSDLGLRLDPRARVRSLSVAEQQMVEIARAVTFQARLIIMDEPTAALSDREVRVLHRIVADLRARGVSIIYVTHRLIEVMEVCDRFTVLRDGCFVADGLVAEHGIPDLIRLMVGRDVEFIRRPVSTATDRVVLKVEDINRARSSRDPHATELRDLSIEVHAGEILGFAGLVGAGRTELARIVFGADRCDDGVLWLGGGEMRPLRSPGEALRKGIALVPEDRKQQGCFLNHSVRQNMVLPNLPALARWKIFVDDAAEKALVEHYRKALSIRMPSQSTPIGKLSGGNQQKVLLARCMALAPRVLIVDEPTRGIDIGAKAEVHQVLADMAANGVGVIVISSELSEVMAVSDRIAVFREGRIMDVVPGDGADEETLMRLMTVGQDRPPVAA
ncbi:monosaccharide ABC transporter ATP-binding protein, CUT2 family [Novosphingobium sp. CF614]|uniref:sugar ABC transporter ATP-binding protein n=1 Tax=Novosphingobium sp. CF614 TaxID=1884364 RepID=UPI0008EE6196|nr:sugar ABC transporter ATP-binding protein [Novosphingobium sp. CF614]SFG07956.1 monosaccharide ABC transporter ATP-binding protein, CUT2 family [Novosphingobium sp. CF614]